MPYLRSPDLIEFPGWKLDYYRAAIQALKVMIVSSLGFLSSEID